MQVPATSSLADSPIVRAMGGSVPEQITIGRAMPTTNTRENRFVVMVLEYLAQRMHEVAIVAGEAGAREVAREARELAGAFERWRRQPALAPLEPVRSLPATSTVRAGRCRRLVAELHAPTVADWNGRFNETRLLERAL